jgi:hypothetical protein
MTKKDKTTPLQAARAYAAEHPEFEGRIEVTVLRPKGRGGWGVMKQSVTAWARDGQAALARRVRIYDEQTRRKVWGPWNGHCSVCGRVYLLPALDYVYRADERAGQPLGPEDVEERERFVRQWGSYLPTLKEQGKGEPVYAQLCSINNVCATCAQALGMSASTRWPRARETNEIECRPTGFAPKPAPPVVYIDLTKRETE